jgi:hypothetical protein
VRAPWRGGCLIRVIVFREYLEDRVVAGERAGAESLRLISDRLAPQSGGLMDHGFAEDRSTKNFPAALLKLIMAQPASTDPIGPPERACFLKATSASGSLLG